MRGKLLIVDDNERIFESLEINFRKLGFECFWAANGTAAMRLIREHDMLAAIIDLSLDNEDGIEIMQKLFEIKADLPAIIITGFGTFSAAVRATKLGAYDFLAKPLNFDKLNEVVQEAMQMHDQYGGIAMDASSMASDFVARSPAMLEVWNRAAQLGPTDIPVLVTGESGTGKEIVSERIHVHSPRKNHKFVRVNCSAITDSLADSELFGHRKGAFTGAATDRIGLLREADGGTLHLDEIGDMSMVTQAKLLRVLEDNRIRPLGGEKEVGIDVRIVASTNKDLEQMVAEGAFRGDLYYRLNAVELLIPPLRERTEDIPPLAELFLKRFSGTGTVKRFSDKAMQRLCQYGWPGNVRELRNAVKVCAAVVPGSIIEAEDLPSTVRLTGKTTSKSIRIADAEKTLIAAALEESGGNRQVASNRLGISRRPLYNKMKTYGLEP